MGYVVELVLGAIGAAAFLALCRTNARFEAPLAAGGLVFAALGYVGYALIAGVAAGAVVWLGVGVFAVFGGLGARASLVFLAVGWGLHAVWDVVVPDLADVAYMPGWYEAVCLGFDLVVGTYFALRFAGRVPAPGAAVAPTGA